MVQTKSIYDTIVMALNDVETQRYKEFQSKHCGVIEIIFTPSGIGTKVEVRCSGCKAREDISDYDCW